METTRGRNRNWKTVNNKDKNTYQTK